MIMRKSLFALALVASPAFGQSSVPISGLPSASTITGSEIVPVVQGGVTKRTTAAGIQQSGTQTANTVLAAPSGSSGAPSFRALTALDMAPLLSTANAWTAQQTINSNLLVGTPTSGFDAGTQTFDFQTQASFLTNGSLGAMYCQRLDTWTGGAASDATAPVSSACRGYNQIQANVTYDVEAGILGVVDNFSYNAQGVGAGGTCFSWHGGRCWGAVNESKEEPETYTATAGQTVFVVPNGFNAIGYVTVNGTLLTAGTQYTVASPNVTLTSGATLGQTVVIARANPAQAFLGAELDATTGPGIDTINGFSGNRIGLSIVNRRFNTALNVLSHAGSQLSLYCSPGDAYMLCDRGAVFQGAHGIGLDFSNSNASYANFIFKLTSAGAGLYPDGNLSLGNCGGNDLAGYSALFLCNTTNGGIARLGDNSVFGRISVSSAFAMQIGSESNIDLIFNRGGAEQARFNSVGFKLSVPMQLAAQTFSVLSTCNSANKGTLAFITDASAVITTWHQQVTAGGGANPAFIACNGTGWYAFDY